MGQEEMWCEGSFAGEKIQSFQTKWQRVPEGQAYRASRSTSPRMSGIQEGSAPGETWRNPLLICREGQTVFKVQQMGSSGAEEASLCTVMSVLPKPPPIPRLCPHSQSKIITLYYRLQTGPVNILPLGCTHSRGMHLKGCSLLCISTQQHTPA